MSSRRNKRILNEIKELHDSKEILEQSGIYFYVNEENINFIYTLLVGPEGTPYEKGFYFFSFEYPENYPMEPPKAKYYTQGFLNTPSNKSFSVRFNPNLYTCGKVCLSMLNTWSGPGWVPTNTISNVLVAIQALVLNEEPLRNEPGFEKGAKTEITKYNDLISFANIKISVFEMIKHTPYDFNEFNNIMNTYFIKNIEYYRNYILTQNIKYLKSVCVQSPAYGMMINLDYESLLHEFEELYENIIKKDNNEKEKNIENICEEMNDMKLDK
jgi:ubiquitin-protein ligase